METLLWMGWFAQDNEVSAKEHLEVRKTFIFTCEATFLTFYGNIFLDLPNKSHTSRKYPCWPWILGKLNHKIYNNIFNLKNLKKIKNRDMVACVRNTLKFIQASRTTVNGSRRLQECNYKISSWDSSCNSNCSYIESKCQNADFVLTQCIKINCHQS